MHEKAWQCADSMVNCDCLVYCTRLYSVVVMQCTPWCLTCKIAHLRRGFTLMLGGKTYEWNFLVMLCMPGTQQKCSWFARQYRSQDVLQVQVRAEVKTSSDIQLGNLTFISVAEHGQIAMRSSLRWRVLPEPKFCCSAILGAPSLSATVKLSSRTFGLGSVMVSFLSKEYRSAILSLGLGCLLPPKQANMPPDGFIATHRWPLCGSKQH